MVIIINTPTIIKQEQKINILMDIQRPQRKRLSRYKLKKQVATMQNILNDLELS